MPPRDCIDDSNCDVEIFISETHYDDEEEDGDEHRLALRHHDRKCVLLLQPSGAGKARRCRATSASAVH